MKKSFQKVVSLAITGTLLCITFVGCTTKAPSSQVPISGTPSSSSATQGGHKRMDKEVTLSYLIYEHTDWPINDESPVRKKMLEETNVKIESIVAPATSFDEKFNVAIMGKRLPDLMMGKNIDVINEYGMKGAFQPLEDLIKQYAPNIEARLDEKVRNMITANDGHIYALPRFGQDRLRTAWLIRKDWLDILEMDIPTTTQEWTEVLRAFKEKDPGKAGDKLVPLMNRSGSSVFMIYSAPTFGLHPEAYTMVDGKYTLNATLPEYKNMIEWYQTLYKEKLFDQEFVTTTSKQWEESISAGYVGAFIDFANRADTFTSVLQKSDPNAEFIVVEPPIGPTGKRGVPSYSEVLTSTSVGITKDCKDIEAALTWLNYLYSEEGSWLTSVGIDGVTYNGVDEKGAPVWIDEIKNSPNNMTITSKYGIQQQMCPRVLTTYEFELIQGPRTLDGKKLCEPYYIEPYFPVQYDAKDAEEMTNYVTVTTPIISQYTDQFITGIRPLSDWDAFQKELKGAGAERMGEIFTAAQSRNK